MPDGVRTGRSGCSFPAMASKPQVIELMLASTLKSVARAEALAHEVCGRAGFDEDDRHRIEMAVHETMINAIRHGNKEDARKRVRLIFKMFPDRLEIRIRDQGPGFELGRVADPLDAGNLLKASGRGIFLVRAFVDELRVRKIEGSGTEVTLVKRKNSNTKSDQGGKHREHEGKTPPR